MRERYRRLYEAVAKCKSKDSALSKRIKGLTNDILSEKIQFEKIKSEESEQMKNLRKLEQERDSVQKVIVCSMSGWHIDGFADRILTLQVKEMSWQSSSWPNLRKCTKSSTSLWIE